MAALAGSVLPVYPHACGRMGFGGVGAWSSEHGTVARMGSALLHPCRPSVKMLCCCDGAAGASGRMVVMMVLGVVVARLPVETAVVSVGQVSSQTLRCTGLLRWLPERRIDYSRPRPKLGFDAAHSLRCGELDLAKATAGVTSSNGVRPLL